ncbi:hypothetical protein M513_05974 [Trichuris suis]|uniref:Uncharacterized protein n=1 Tax=Trichuris suis TaxID=68888 RepID=A0A085M764_9BILA|nr:hypothetical protein M513_05974 [Trichuris suis]
MLIGLLAAYCHSSLVGRLCVGWFWAFHSFDEANNPSISVYKSRLAPNIPFSISIFTIWFVRVNISVSVFAIFTEFTRIPYLA